MGFKVSREPAQVSSRDLFQALKADPAIELDIHTGELLFEWYSLEHITPKCEFSHPIQRTNISHLLQTAQSPLKKKASSPAAAHSTHGTTST